MPIADVIARGLGFSPAIEGFLVTLGYGALSAEWSSVYARLLLATQEAVQSLGLESLAAQSVIVRKLPVDRHLGVDGGTALPAIVITPVGEAVNAAAGTNLMDDVVYGVRLTMIDRDNQEPTLVANVGRTLFWRQQISRTFRNRALAGVPEIYTAQVEPGEVVDPAAWQNNLLTSVLTLRFFSREPRGAST